MLLTKRKRSLSQLETEEKPNNKRFRFDQPKDYANGYDEINGSPEHRRNSAPPSVINSKQNSTPTREAKEITEPKETKKTIENLKENNDNIKPKSQPQPQSHPSPPNPATPNRNHSPNGINSAQNNDDDNSQDIIMDSSEFEKRKQEMKKQREEYAKRMMQKERERMLRQLSTAEHSNKELYQSFNDLQGIARQLNMNFEFPEIVVVGMQSDGKSSFVEALLGFQFNMIDTQLGTRRPLILQMINDPSIDEPHCVFWKEGGSSLENKPTPVSKLEEEIKNRTDALIGPREVSSVPIILRVKYKYCANLTIYDTPGFRRGEQDPMSDKIAEMVLELMRPKHRIIVGLEQSTVEYCNTLVRPIIKKVDPSFSRTVFIITKFNNRCNQFKDDEEANQYLSADEVEICPYFMSLPSGPDTRDLSRDEFKDKMLEVYLEDYRKLCWLGFDEKRFRPKIGIFHIKQALEKKLNTEYRKCCYPILQKLEEQCKQLRTQLEKVDSQLEKSNAESATETISRLVNQYVSWIHDALKGTNLFDTLQNGMTLDEEKQLSGLANWPHYDLDFNIRNSRYKLYGGAQLERLLAEFEVVAHSQEFPETTDDEVAVTIGLNDLHTTPDYDRGASDLAHQKSKLIFKPLVEVLIQRSKFIMMSLFQMVIRHMRQTVSSSSAYQGFFEELQNLSEDFIDQVCNQVYNKSNDEFNTFTKILDWDLVNYGRFSDSPEYDLLRPSAEDTLKRVKSTMEENSEKFQAFAIRSRELDEEACNRIKLSAARLFAGVRLMFVKYIRAKYNAFFLSPIFNTLNDSLRKHFNQLHEEELKEMLDLGVKDMRRQRTNLQTQLKELEKNRDKFRDLVTRFIKQVKYVMTIQNYHQYP
eukprot:gb/GECH01008962.1/.p1 GENE.gb/GECH01008962.1/~~gb/GECH01008962.1/.p1  ORF type:complete len:869 (+),score=229.05 gb/GECH01008962.1/:1-2607(+)